MRRVMCGKMVVAYQNVDIGKGPDSVVYKVGPKAGQRQRADGSSKTIYRLSDAHNQNDTAIWNIISMTMCFQPQSPDSNVSPAFPLSCGSPSTPSGRMSSDGEKLSSPSCTITSADTSRLYSGLDSPLEGAAGQENRGRSECSTDSDGEIPTASHFEKQYGSPRVDQSYGGRTDSLTSLGARPLEIPTDEANPCSSSSSIGVNDDSSCSSGDGEVSTSGDMEVESVLRSSPLHHTSALETSLPVKRGLSRFWSGKAKSFSSLADVSSVEELAKPDNPYAKRRRTTFPERHKSFPTLSRTSTAGISKKPTSNSSSRGGLAMVSAMGSKLARSSTEQATVTLSRLRVF